MSLIPDDVDFLANAATSAVRARGATPNVDTSEGRDVSVALKCIGAHHGWKSQEELTSLEDEQTAAPLIAAARTLIAVAQSLRQVNAAAATEAETEEEERAVAANGLTLHAAIAFGMHGNFPSAKAAMLEVSDEYLMGSPARRIAAIICDPSRLEELAKEPDSTSDEGSLYDAWREAIVISSAEKLEEFLDGFGEIALDADVSDRGLMLSAEVAARQAFRLATSRLIQEAPELPKWLVTRLVRSGVFTLLPPQRQLLSSVHIAATSGNVLLNLPTSTGKTLIAEACMAHAVKNGGVAVFVAPYVAIGEQVRQSLRRLFYKQASVVSMFGGFKSEMPNIDLHQPQLIVATPERFDGLLRSGAITHALKLVVLDEFHIMENGPRGTKVEGIVARLRLLQQTGHPMRLMALSAVLPDADQLIDWLDVPEANFFRVGWRPTARRLAVCRSDGELFWIYGTDSLRPSNKTAGNVLGQTSVKLPHSTRAGKYFPTHRQSVESAENVTTIAMDMAKRIQGAGLIVCPRKSDTRIIARALANQLPRIENDDAIFNVASDIEKRYEWLNGLADCMRHGVAFHNASIPFDVRRDIEKAMRNRQLQFVVSTTTLAEGADLPFRWTLLSHWLTGVHEGARPVKALTFRNIAGRSGRANAYTEGDTIVYENLLGHVRDVGDITHRNKRLGQLLFEQTPLVSTLATSQEPTEDVDRPAIEANFSSQLLAAIAENPKAEDIVSSLANATYASATGAAKEARDLARKLMDQLLDAKAPGGALAVVNSPAKLTELGAAANRAGFSPQSSRVMVEFLLADDFPDDRVELLELILKDFSQLPEQSERLLRKLYGDKRFRSFVSQTDVQDIIRQAIAKVQPREIFEALPKRQNSTAAEPYIEAQFDEFVSFLDSSIRSFLPWTLRALTLLSQFGSPAARQITWERLADNLESIIALDDLDSN